MLELHGYETGNCLRVSVALEEAGVPYSVSLVDLRIGQHHSREHLSLNPSGKVPTIVDHSTESQPFVLSQSNAIIFYIDQKVPGVLFPTDERQRAIAYERFFYFVTDVIGPSMAAFRLRGIDHARQSLLEGALSAWADSARFLENSQYMAGDAFSAADIAAGVFINAYHRHIDWTAAPELKRWHDEITQRPSFRRGLAAFRG